MEFRFEPQIKVALQHRDRAGEVGAAAAARRLELRDAAGRLGRRPRPSGSGRVFAGRAASCVICLRCSWILRGFAWIFRGFFAEFCGWLRMFVGRLWILVDFYGASATFDTMETWKVNPEIEC